MADLELEATWAPAVYQLELTDPVQGGPDGVDNLQAKQLGDRTEYLKQHVDNADGYIALQQWQNVGAVGVGTAGATTLFDFVFPSPGLNYVIEIEVNSNGPAGELWAGVARVRTFAGASAGTAGLRWKVAAYDLTFTLDTSSGAHVLIKGQLSGGGAPGSASVLVRWRVVWSAIF
jgi:hypothetical protein